MKSRLAVLTAILVLGCSTAHDTAPASAAAKPSEFKNLKVLPRDIPRDELIATMRMFTRSLNVRCDHCHVVTAVTPKQEFDFPSDAKDTKRAARVMIQMTSQINKEWLERVEEAEREPGEPAHESADEAHDEPRVVCWTCHRGMPEPEMMPPPPPQNAAPAPPKQ